MFRDSRGVVHTVTSADPLDDLPAEAGAVLARFLLVPVGGDLGGALERCEAVAGLLDRWQDAFFAALPDAVDRDEEREWASRAGLDLEDLEQEWEDEHPHDTDLPDLPDLADLGDLGDLEPEVVQDWGEPEELIGLEPVRDPALAAVPEQVAAELELAVGLLPLRVRLEALVAASGLVEEWAELFADHEKLLGHLVLAHGQAPVARAHEELADLHASLHRSDPRHSGGGLSGR